MRAQLGTLENHDGVYVLDGEMLFIKQLAGVLKEQKAVRALPLGIGVGKMHADIAEAGRSKQRVTERVRHDVAVGMPHRSFVKRNLNAADDELSAFRKAVQVVADAAADAHAFFRSICR